MAAEPFQLLFRPEVEDDLRALGAEDRRRILAVIRSRLKVEPALYGKPLGGSLKGLRRVRTGDCRIAYQIKGRQVIVWAVLRREKIYRELERRLSLPG